MSVSSMSSVDRIGGAGSHWWHNSKINKKAVLYRKDDRAMRAV